jgi:predicted anti-sigma-YlaC factor YlaD
MSDHHQAMRELLARKRVEALPRKEELRLNAHLAECEACAAADLQMSIALSALRRMPIAVPRGLAARTQLRVRMRAEEMREHGPKRRLIWLISAISWALGVATAPWVWKGFEWMGQHTGAPKPLWEFGFVLWWAIPAALAVCAVLLERRGASAAAEGIDRS